MLPLNSKNQAPPNVKGRPKAAKYKNCQASRSIIKREVVEKINQLYEQCFLQARMPKL